MFLALLSVMSGLDSAFDLDDLLGGFMNYCRTRSGYQRSGHTLKSAVKPEPELKNTIGSNLNPSDGPGKPNSISMKTVKTKWALNHLQQPICVQLTKTVKTLKARS
ncbi:hypothetical protein Tco_0824562 [Tanacetum coccineum]|uniref:Uncharacterized protein n=1 Tax=Tanacetum coccineum TaxID=301880 RepID=A0ABQ5AQE8_9ASTR